MENTENPSKLTTKVRSSSLSSDSGIDLNVSSKSSEKYKLLNSYVPNRSLDNRPPDKPNIKSIPSSCRIEECTSTQSEQLQLSENVQDKVPERNSENLVKTAEDVDIHMAASSHSRISLQEINMHQSKDNFSSNTKRYKDISDSDMLDSQADDDMVESVSQSNVPLIDSDTAVQNSSTKTITAQCVDSNVEKVAEELGSDSGFSACSPSSTSIVSTNNVTTLKKERYKRTADALQGSGLMDVTMKTAELLKKNRALQKDIEQFKKESALFLEKVLNNPENADLRDLLLKAEAEAPNAKKTKFSSAASNLTSSEGE